MSDFMRLNLNDFLKGLLISVLSATFTCMYDLLANNGAFDLKKIGTVALMAGLAYISKNFFTDGKKTENKS